ncbi:delta 1-pyrroline-5-carboxylate reductase [Arachnomyces sp. PD_36]|nr:delta 1-pyrroline-5-carboxylate reductase [Arachnomyces sp. PD_36]
MATTATLNTKGKDMTLTFLGCGNLGTAILSGILASITESKSQSGSAPDTGAATPSKFIACVRRPESEQRILKAVEHYGEPVTVLKNENIKGVEESDVVILGCKPYMIKDVLAVDGMREALKGKLLISILAGVPATQLESTLYGDSDLPQEDRCHIVRAMPNTAAVIRESMTVIEISTPPLPAHLNALTDWIFTRIGKVAQLPAATMDASTALAGSGPAFMALVLEAMADGALAMGLPRAEAQLMAAQVMRGTTGMVLNGEHPAILREKVCTPGGCTIGGLLVLEEAAVRGTVSRAVREAAVVASQLGQGVKGVNGTRH